ncbi:MAG: hypothetical protein NC548_56650 [Lachnospiraceae bacterium]|nr:hypothetical protein [Lachnospiraceae bacterium]
MGLVRRHLLKRAINANWAPKVVFDIGKWGFVITMVNPTPIRFLLEDDSNELWKRVSEIAYNATNEIIDMIGYNINDINMDRIRGKGVSMNDADDITTSETLALHNYILMYEDKYDMSIKDWFIDYIMIHGKEFI